MLWRGSRLPPATGAGASIPALRSQDIRDARGNLIAAQGQRFNPLTHLNLAHSFAFIDGDSAAEREWALRQGAPDKLWIVLVKGSPTDLMKATQRRFYFDQMGSLTGKFGIAHTPALLVQQGDHLDIREVALPNRRTGGRTPMKRIRPVFWKRFGRGLAPARRAARPAAGQVLGHDRRQLALGSAQVAQAQGSPTCHGHFPNPITDICWDCFFPLSIGGFDLWPSDKPDPGNPSLPVCLCGIRPGLSFGFWEPVRLIDVTTKPFCFPNLGGLTINPGMYVGNGHVSAASQKGGNTQMSAQYQAHYYVYPLFYLLELLGISSALNPPRSIWPI
jgi:hypothetical protein